MRKTIVADIAIIGGGSGGLSVAAGAAQMGAKVVLVEKHKMGGDCLNYGCVPSKALIAAGEAAQMVRDSGRFGVNGHEPAIDFAKVNAHVHGVIAAIAPHDSVERFERLGVQVIKAAGKFVSPTALDAGGHMVTARRFVVATGSRAFLPPIPGLDTVPYLTNETVFDLKEPPSHLIVIGGGPIGLELAQAHRRLGCKVTVIEAFSILPKDDPAATDVVRRRLLAEGLEVVEGAKVTSVAMDGNRIAAWVDDALLAEMHDESPLEGRGHEDLDRRDHRARVAARVHHVRAVQRHQPRALDVHERVGDEALDELLGLELAAVHLAVDRALHHQVERAPHLADRVHAVVHPSRPEAVAEPAPPPKPRKRSPLVPLPPPPIVQAAPSPARPAVEDERSSRSPARKAPGRVSDRPALEKGEMPAAGENPPTVTSAAPSGDSISRRRLARPGSP